MLNIPKDISIPQYYLYISGYEYCDNLVKANVAIDAAIEKTLTKYEGLIDNPKEFKEFLESEVTAFTDPNIIITNPEIRDNTWWDRLKKQDFFKAKYWERYKRYLQKKPFWELNAIEELDDSTDKVMNNLANPMADFSDDRIGLVFGYVQSGKTAHYISLINKAIDAGYRIIIVLSGIHNNLRSQTQSRIDEEVLGYETSLESLEAKGETFKSIIGVGLDKYSNVERFQSITTQDGKGDVNSKTAGVSMMPPYIIVTKKNASVLRKIIKFLKKSPISSANDDINKYPALIIDDEADQASLNTKESYDEKGELLEDYNPTTINKLIRQILALFSIKSYVGYTATPFANIFIPPHIDSDEYGQDLYPKDFIMRAPRASQYVGAREFFGIGGSENAPVMPLNETIKDGKDYLKGLKADDENIGELPDEVKQAVKCFLISTAIRNCRGQRNMPNTMLIHIVRFVKQQKIVKKKVEEYCKELCDYIHYGDSETENKIKKIWEDNYCVKTREMRNRFPKYMKGCTDVPWYDLWSEIKRIVAARELVVYCINGQSKDALIYKDKEGMPFNVIVIGGDKLSRGLTLEGLTISYFTRTSNTYDTLMQMGRWFGFRPGYLDLCRLFTTKELRADFAHISMASEDLAAQFDYMNDIAGATPMEFGLRVATHPDLEITSKNKLRTGTETQSDYSCKLSQTRVFDNAPDKFEQNFETVENLLLNIEKYSITPEDYENTHGRVRPGNHFFWQNVPPHDIIDFFENYQTSKSAKRISGKYIADYIKTINQVGGLSTWTVCLLNIHGTEPDFNIANLKTVGAGISREEGKGVDSSNDPIISIKTMTSKDHEYFDYTLSDLNKVEEIRKAYGEEKNEGSLNEIIRKATRPFEKGLLLLYPIAEAGKLTENLEKHHRPFGFAVVFPDRNGKGKLKNYRINDIAMEGAENEFDY